MKDISQKLLAVFVSEHREHLLRMRLLLGPPGGGAPALSVPAIEELLRRAHTLKGAARAVGIAEIETLAHRMESLFGRLREGVLALDGAAVETIHSALDATQDATDALLENRRPPEIQPVLAALETVGTTPAPPAAAPPAPALAIAESFETVRVSAEALDRLLTSSAQVLTEALAQDHVTTRLQDLYREVKHLPGVAEHARATCLAQRRTAWALAQVADQVEQHLRQLRMAPADSVFDAFRSMVRDLAREEAKEIDFRLEGLDAQADRTVLQALKDPVMHLLRNAVSHGIETPAQRVAAGKPPAGRVTLRLATRGDRLDLTVEDDGRGIDFEAVSDAAVRRGLLTEPEAAARRTDDLLQLLLQLGFSTAKTVTRLAGRGIGLAVVHERVRRLQGELSMRQQPGRGASFTLSVPLSVSTHHVILAGCGGRTFAIPVRGIERLRRVRVREIVTVDGRETLNCDGEAVPLATLAQLLELPEQPRTGPVLPVILLRAGGHLLAVAADTLEDERSVLVHELGVPVRMAGKASGAVLLDDGGVAIVINPTDLIDTWRASGKSASFTAKTVEKEARQSKILVVDDSITTRSLERSILEAHGYQVRVAVDGIEALEQLRAKPADLVIADILMPRLDGFGLIEAMKKDRDLRSIPVIVVSSRASGEDRQRGLALGADAYIVKQKFDQRELLEVVRQIL